MSTTTTRDHEIGAPPRRRLSAAERRSRILEAGTEVFAEHGYAGATIAEIAARAGVVASVIYDHFESKQELQIILLRLHGEQLIRRSIDEVGRRTAHEPRALFDAGIEAYFRLVEEDPFVWRFLFREAPADPEIAAVHREIHDAATAGIAELIRLGAPKLTPIEGTDPGLTRLMIAKASQAATNGLADWWYVHREVPRERIVELAKTALWDGLERVLERASPAPER